MDSEINLDGYPILLDGLARLRAMQHCGATPAQIERFIDDREREARDRLTEQRPASPWPPSGTH